MKQNEEKETTITTSSTHDEFEHPDTAGPPRLDNVSILNDYWDGNLSLAEAQVLDILNSK